MPAKTKADPAHVASDLRVVLGQLMRRLRNQRQGFSISHAAVLGRLDRCGPRSVSDLATAEMVRPQSMAQTVGDLEAEGLVTRRPDPGDRRRALVELTDAGLEALQSDRAVREGWLAQAIAAELSPAELDVLESAVEMLSRLAER